MKTKQEVIQSALTENWDLLFDSEREHSLQNDGWIPNTGLKLINKITFDIKEMHITYGNPEQWLRPKSLAGIETNNGWTCIESEDDLPKEKGDYWVIWDGRIVITYWYGKDNQYADLEKQNRDWMKVVTHYQPIIKPLPPIY
jgi:hypothetical protein